MLKFIKLNEKTLYADITVERLVEMGIDIHQDDKYTQEKIMEIVAEGLQRQSVMELSNPLSVSISVTDVIVKIIVTKVNIEDFQQFMQDDDVEYRTFHQGEDDDGETIEVLFSFKDFENIVQMASSYSDEDLSEVITDLYVYKNKYYLLFNFFMISDKDELEDKLSCIKEYGNISQTSMYLIHEYGKKIIEDDALETIKHHFIK